MTPVDAPLILVTAKDEDAQKAIFNPALIALDSRVAGFLEGGMEAWTAAGLPMADASGCPLPPR